MRYRGYLCPAAPAPFESHTYTAAYTGGYLILQYLSYQVLATGSLWYGNQTFYNPLTTVKRPEKISFWGEGATQGAAWDFTYPLRYQQGLSGGERAPILRHEGRINLGFLDGHCRAYSANELIRYPNNEVLERDRDDL